MPSFDAAARRLGLPLFIKPARQGSSVGVSKVKTQEGLRRRPRGRFQA